MTTAPEFSVTDRIVQLLQYLGLDRAHFAARSLNDLDVFVGRYPERITSLTLVCPTVPAAELVGPLASRLLVFRGESSGYDRLGQFVESLPGATLAVLHNDTAWSDLVALHAEEIKTALLPFLAARSPDLSTPPLPDGERGLIASISYHLQGSAAADAGSAAAGLYRRFQASPLTDVKMFPYLAAFNEEFIIDIFRDAVSHVLDEEERAALHAACEQARADGTFVFSYPHHCAVGTKPL